MVWTALTYARPSKAKLNGSYGLVAATLTSGTFLVVQTQGPLLKACLTGLVYLGIVFGGIIAARYRLNIVKEYSTNERSN